MSSVITETVTSPLLMMKPVAKDVLNTSEFVSIFDREKISASIFDEVNYVASIFNMEQQITLAEADEVSRRVENHILTLNGDLKNLSGPLIREMVCGELKGRQRDFYTRVGLSIADAFKIDNAVSDVTHDNANQTKNAETKHKQKADQVAKEQALLTIPSHLAEAHLRGDIHIHDLEYFTTRTFCMDHDLRFWFYYGFDSDCTGKTNIAAAAQKPTVALLHAAKILGSAQTNFSVDGNEEIFLIGDNNVAALAPIGYFVDNLMKGVKTQPIPEIYGESYDISERCFKTIAFNPVTFENETKLINKVIRHPIHNDLLNIITKSGRNVTITDSHSVFIFDENNKPVSIPASELKISDELVIPSTIPLLPEIDGIDLIYEMEILKKTDINDIFVVDSGFKTGVLGYDKRDSIPLSYIYENSIKLDSKECCLRNSRSKHKIPAYIPLSTDLFRLLGYYTSEGHITQIDGTHQVGFSYGTAKSPEAVEDTQNLLNSIFNLPSRVYATNESTNQVTTSSKTLCLIFKSIFNCGVRGTEKRMPRYVLNACEKDKMEFLRGYFLDGNSRRREISFKTASKKLASDISYLLLQFGIVSRIETGVSPERMTQDRIISESVYYRIIVYGRKNLELLETITRDGFDKYKTEIIYPSKENKINIGNLCSDTVISIDSVKSTGKYVYDLSVEGYENFLGGHGGIMLHNSGGQGYYNFLTFISPYLEGLPYKEIKQLMQMFIFEISQTMVARGAQVVFSSIQLSPGVPKIWADKPAVFKGKVWNGEHGTPYRPYRDFEREVRLSFRALMEVMYDGDAWGKMFNFPKPEIAFEEEFMIDHEDDIFYNERKEIESKLEELTFPKYERMVLENQAKEIPMTYSELYNMVMELTIKFGTPYYDNMLPKYRQKGGIQCYQCCAFSFSVDTDSKNFDEKMMFKDGQHFSMGANQVISINLPRASYKVPEGDFEALLEESKHLIMQAIEVHEFKRDWISKLWYAGHMPFATQQLKHPGTNEISPPAVDYEELVYTIGVIGINEVAMRLTGEGFETDEGLKLGLRLMNNLNTFVHEEGERRGISLVLARTPAESASQRFAVSDLMLYRDEAQKYVQGDIETALEKLDTSTNLPVYYSNGTHLPVNTKVGIVSRLKKEAKFFHALDGGNIFHLWMGESDPSPVALKEFIFKILKNTQIGYFTFTKDFSMCDACGNQMNGIKFACDKCGSDEVKAFSRITGYIQDVSGWNASKRQELEDRTRTDVFDNLYI